jgi:hypothetical protein
MSEAREYGPGLALRYLSSDLADLGRSKLRLYDDDNGGKRNAGIAG